MGTTIAGLLTGLLELAHDAVALGGRGVDRDQVVVVQVDAPGADFAQHGRDVVGRHGGAHGVAEGIAAAVAQRPQSERELVFGLRLVVRLFAHGFPLRFCSHVI